MKAYCQDTCSVDPQLSSKAQPVLAPNTVQLAHHWWCKADSSTNVRIRITSGVDSAAQVDKLNCLNRLSATWQFTTEWPHHNLLDIQLTIGSARNYTKLCLSTNIQKEVSDAGFTLSLTVGTSLPVRHVQSARESAHSKGSLTSELRKSPTRFCNKSNS